MTAKAPVWLTKYEVVVANATVPVLVKGFAEHGCYEGCNQQFSAHSPLLDSTNDPSCLHFSCLRGERSGGANGCSPLLSTARMLLQNESVNAPEEVAQTVSEQPAMFELGIRFCMWLHLRLRSEVSDR